MSCNIPPIFHVHTSFLSFHILLPPLSTLSHSRPRLSASYNLSVLSMCHASDHVSITSYWLFFFLLDFVLYPNFHFSSSLTSHCWSRDKISNSERWWGVELDSIQVQVRSCLKEEEMKIEGKTNKCKVISAFNSLMQMKEQKQKKKQVICKHTHAYSDTRQWDTD